MDADRKVNSNPVFRSPSSDETWIEEGIFVTELMNSSANERVSLAQCRLPTGKRTRWHALSVDEWYVIVAGRGRMELDSGQAYNVRAGDSVTIKAGRPQRIENTGHDDLVFHSICMPRFTPACYTDLEAKE